MTTPADLRARMVEEMAKALDQLWADRCREYLSTKLLNAMAEAALTAQTSVLREAGLRMMFLRDAGKSEPMPYTDD